VSTQAYFPLRLSQNT